MCFEVIHQTNGKEINGLLFLKERNALNFLAEVENDVISNNIHYSRNNNRIEFVRYGCNNVYDLITRYFED